MIRNNYSLSNELRKTEKKKQAKVQQRQKHLHNLEKLNNTDPIALYKKIQRLKAGGNNEKDKATLINQGKYLKGLESDWDFIIKHKLHAEKVQAFLSQLDRQDKEQKKLDKKLWGLKSVFFNPELNPLGKVPDVSKTSFVSNKPFANITVPIKPHMKAEYPQDPLISHLNIKPPPGDPPRFYKKVYNTDR